MATIEERLARLESFISLDMKSGMLIIKAPKGLRLAALAIEIESSARILMKSGASVEIVGGAQLTLKGGIIRLNNGSSPLTRVGDRVVPSFPPFMRVDSGNATVLA